jgi:hypothetical protein
MDGKKVAAWAVGITGVLCPVVFWFLRDGTGEGNAFVVLYELAPLTVVALAFGPSRMASPAAPALEMIASGLWCLTLLLFALWHPLFSTVERVGSRALDLIALTVGCTGAALVGVAASAFLPVRRPPVVPAAAWYLQGLGVGILGLYLGRAGLLLYASTRATLSGGLSAVSYEVNLRLLICGAAAIALAASAVMARGGRNEAL